MLDGFKCGVLEGKVTKLNFVMGIGSSLQMFAEDGSQPNPDGGSAEATASIMYLCRALLPRKGTIRP